MTGTPGVSPSPRAEDSRGPLGPRPLGWPRGSGLCPRGQEELATGEPGWKLPSGRRGQVRKASPPQPCWEHRRQRAAPTRTALGTALVPRGLGARSVPALGAWAGLGRPAALSAHFLLAPRAVPTPRAPLPSPGHPGDGVRGRGMGMGELAPLPQGSEAPRAWSSAASSRQPPRQAPQTLSTCHSDSYLLGTPTHSLLPQAHGRPSGSATRQLAGAQSCGPQRPFP